MHSMMDLAQACVQKGASDIYIKAGSPPMLRIRGVATPIAEEKLMPNDTAALAQSILARDKDRGQFDQHLYCNLAWSAPQVGRFRVNVYMQRGTVAMVLRLVESKVPSLQQYGYPEILSELIMEKTGLILVTGATGSGKSTTLAAMIDHRNANSRGHILTLEDPIEFLHPDKSCIISQREVGTDCENFEDALKDALRQAPDVILLGEIRSLETMEAALHMAETGHLVLGTLHATNATQTIERIMNFFPKEAHEHYYLNLALNLRGIVSQRLIPTPDGRGRVAAQEILVATPRVRDLVRKAEVTDLKPVMNAGIQEGMQTFDQALYNLVQKERISEEQALSYAESPGDLKLKLRGFT
ncbi:MAG: PilT/PilU family type 4a pilus ATPase [Armatimonadetes bacterium]|nr:PilT/PilU family type 4a pilus ATPase [Armatimonadota bacterium]